MKEIVQKRKHDVVWHRSGKIELSAYVVRELGIARGDSIGVVCDNVESYLCVSSKGGQGIRCKATCYPVHRGGKSMKAHSKELTGAVYRIAGESSAERLRMAVGEVVERDGRKMLTLLTRLRL